MAELTEKEKIDATIRFFKEAFCVDGEVRMILDVEERRKFVLGGVMELNDSKRGKFYVAYVSKNS